MNRLAIVIIGLSLLSGCSLFSTEPDETKLTQGDTGRTIMLSSKQTLSVTLASNGTTGYQWNLVTEPDVTVLKLVSSRYNAPASDLVGAGGTETWAFQAVGGGSTSFKLGYFRPFDPQQAGGEFTLNVTVR